MTRFRLKVEYDGSAYVGWQRQDTGLGVQQVVEEAIFAFSGENARVYCAGRTDAGVHARGQVAHFDLKREDVTTKTVRDAINFHSKPHGVSVVAAQVVGEDFHARFSATEREYLYIILNRRARPALDLGHVWWVPTPLDAEAMHDAAQALIGKHDFTTFRASICQSQSPVKTMDEITVTRHGDEIHVKARARSFLHHQVRNIVGTLRQAGKSKGRWSPADMKRALDARDRSAAGQTAPPDGLYLMRVGYDPRDD